MDDFLSTAELADTDFTTERTQNIKIVSSGGVVANSNPHLLSKDEFRALRRKQRENNGKLTVPRRPHWTEDMTAHQLDRLEKDAFLEWRRELAMLQENNDLLLTPFERNIEVWRQLWRVVDRSDLVVQIVDARNPMLFRSEDLEHYAKEIDEHKRNLLLINKADLMTHKQRKIWAQFFADNGIRYAFFSAKTALKIVEEQREAEQQESSEEEEEEDHKVVASSRFAALLSDDDDDEDEDEDEDDEEKDNVEKVEDADNVANADEDDDEDKIADQVDAEDYDDDDGDDDDDDDVYSEDQVDGDETTQPAGSQQQSGQTTNYAVMTDDPTRILTIDQLEGLLLSEAPEPKTPGAKLQIGLVGYPNVGKSSTINALIGAKKVSVSSTPGKTKHFQTIHLSDRIVLCDCPGLVFPNFATTNADLVCNGVLPIDQLREFSGPVQLVCERIPKYFLEALYGITIFTKPLSEGGAGTPTAEELLVAYARSRGFMRSGVGAPDESRAARYVLKDYVNAKLLYCHPPHTYSEADDAPENPGAEFNKELYTLQSLPETRQQQILAALQNATGEAVDADAVNLATALEGLRFSQHGSTDARVNVSTASDKLDRDFFAMGNSQGHALQPFHQRNAAAAASNSKKHFKKGGKRRNARGDTLSYGGAFGDLY